MPTMPKLFAAVLMAVFGYVVADRVAGHLPEEVQQGLLRPITAFFGILVGWRFLGRRVGGSMRSALGMGLSAAFALLLVSLIFFSGNEMLRRALRKTYKGAEAPFLALQDMVQISLDFRVHLFYADVVTTFILGGLIVGVIVELVARRWS